MKFRILNIALFAVLALASCSKTQEPEDSGTVAVFHSAIENDLSTKTFLDTNHKLLWTEDDRISVFTTTANQQYRFMGKTGAYGGDFEKVSSGTSSGSALSANYALYPYDAAASISSSGIISLTIPSEQKYREGTFCPGVNAMVAVTKDETDNFLSFKNLCGYLVVKLYGKATVSTLTLTGNNGEKLSGAASVKPEFGKAPSLEMSSSASSSINVACGSGVNIGKTESECTEFWFCLPPTIFSKGFSIEIADVSGEKISKIVSDSHTVERNIINYMAPLKVRVTEPSAPKAIDLGLGVKWAQFNVGATKEQEYGYYYAWGELEPSLNSWTSYKWRKSGTDWDNVKLTKYNTDSAFGNVDGKIVLESSDDIASESYGGSWRMPSDAEWKELLDNCDWTWDNVEGINGYRVRSRIPGYEEASIFLPAAGYRYDNVLYAEGKEGGYWSSSLYLGITSYAWAVNFDTDILMRYYMSRCYGHSVRAVTE